MSKRTNKLYTVTVVQYANMAVEADSPKEAMEIAEKYKDEYITDRDFEDSEIDVYQSDSESFEIDELCLDYKENVYTKDGVMTCNEYCKQLK